MKRAFAILLMLVIGAVCLAIPYAAAQEVLPLYGLPTATSALMRLVNCADETIVEMYILPAENKLTDETPGLLGEDDFLAEARLGLWVELQPEWLPAGEAALYDIHLIFAQDEMRTLHNVPVADIGEAVISRDSNVVWLTYTSLSTGEEVSTWLDELHFLAQMEAVDVPLTDDEGRENDVWDPDRSS